MCDKRRELKTKSFEPEGSKKYKEVNNNIKGCIKKAKENWIAEQCSESEENLKKNKSKRAYQLEIRNTHDEDRCKKNKKQTNKQKNKNKKKTY